MESVVYYESNEVEPNLEGTTQGHSMESMSVSAAQLATHGIYAPSVIWSRWYVHSTHRWWHPSLPPVSGAVHAIVLHVKDLSDLYVRSSYWLGAVLVCRLV